ncbi:hypothetical protein [Bradyrhizobium guangdongense]|nr:hypothetical protein [Bradyrhizobium guangdongense]
MDWQLTTNAMQQTSQRFAAPAIGFAARGKTRACIHEGPDLGF